MSADIDSLVPHAGKMCLLDTVSQWDSSSIACAATGHADPDHPLARGGSLSAIHLAEYGAQAAAVHGALLAGGQPQPGFVAAFRNVQLHVDAVPGDQPLQVEAKRLAGSATAMQYQFDVSAAGRALARGRRTVALRGDDDDGN